MHGRRRATLCVLTEGPEAAALYAAAKAKPAKANPAKANPKAKDKALGRPDRSTMASRYTELNRKGAEAARLGPEAFAQQEAAARGASDRGSRGLS